MEMDTQHSLDASSNNKQPLSTDIYTPDLLSKHNNLNEPSENTINKDQSNVAEQSLDSNYTSNLKISKINQSHTNTMDQTNTTSSNLVELSDLGVTENNSFTVQIEIDRLDNIDDVNKDIDVELLEQSNILLQSESATYNDAGQQNMSTDRLESNLDHPEIVNNVNKLTSPDQNSNNYQLNLVQPSSHKIDQHITKSTENVVQNTTLAGTLDQPSTSTGKFDVISSTIVDMLNKLGTIIEKSNQGNLENQGVDSVSHIDTKEFEKEKVKLFAEDRGPHWHNVVSNMITLPVIGKKLPEAFKDLPIFGKPENKVDIESFYDTQIRNFIGCDLNDAEFTELKDYCSIDNLFTGKEFTMTNKIPQVGIPMGGLPEQIPEADDKPDLFVLRKLKNRIQKDPRNLYAKKLKYRGIRTIPMSSQEEYAGIPETKPPDLEPGKDVLYRIRVYRPFMFSTPRVKAQIRGRHSVFSCDVVVCGRQPLTALRDRLVCRNDADLRLDVSRRPYDRANATAKDMFPSGFLFINNVFYVDRRGACYDTSAVIRNWSVQRGIGRFPVRDMATVNMHDANVRLAHPEVYVHQGNCEHVFLISEIRLLNYSDPLHLSCYPCHSAVSNNQTIYCTTCAEFGAKWIVTGCDRVPFDPAFFCEICFKQYLYKDGKKIGDFKAYAYKGNELCMLKPLS